MRMKWLGENSMKSLHPPKVKQNPTLPFSSQEVSTIVSGCDRFPIKGIHSEGNRKRLRAMILLLRYSGLRIRDAATLRRECSATIRPALCCLKRECYRMVSRSSSIVLFVATPQF